MKKLMLTSSVIFFSCGENVSELKNSHLFTDDITYVKDHFELPFEYKIFDSQIQNISTREHELKIEFKKAQKMLATSIRDIIGSPNEKYPLKLEKITLMQDVVWEVKASGKLVLLGDSQEDDIPKNGASISYSGHGGKFRMSVTFSKLREDGSREELFFPVRTPVTFWKVKTTGAIGVNITPSTLAKSFLNLPEPLAEGIGALMNNIGSLEAAAKLSQSSEWLVETSEPFSQKGSSKLAYSIAEDVFYPLCLQEGKTPEQCKIIGVVGNIPELKEETKKYEFLKISKCVLRSGGVGMHIYDIYAEAPKPIHKDYDFLQVRPYTYLNLFMGNNIGNAYTRIKDKWAMYLGESQECSNISSHKRCTRFELHMPLYWDGKCNAINYKTEWGNYAFSIHEDGTLTP
jgi:hypothetical protein